MKKKLFFASLCVLLALALLILPVRYLAACSPFPCSSVMETNFPAMYDFWVSSFGSPYMQWLDDQFNIIDKHKKQPGVFKEADDVQGILGWSSNNPVADSQSSLSNISGSMSVNDSMSTPDRAEKHMESLDAQMSFLAYNIAKRAYDDSLAIEKTLGNFSPSKMDFESSSQAIKDIARIQLLRTQVIVETAMVRADLIAMRLFKGRIGDDRGDFD